MITVIGTNKFRLGALSILCVITTSLSKAHFGPNTTVKLTYYVQTINKPVDHDSLSFYPA